MILTVTPNPAIDLTLTTGRLGRGETNVVPAARRRAGGKGINVARVLAEQTVDVVAVAPVGRADLAWFTSDLGPVAHRWVSCERPTRCSYALVETDDDVTTILNEAGESPSGDEWREVVGVVDQHLGDAGCVVVSGSVPVGSPPDLVADLVRRAHDAGAAVVADVTGAHLLAAARAGADVLKPNRAELRQCLGDVAVLDGARELQRLGAGTVVVSLGDDGLVVVPPGSDQPAVHARLPQPLRGNPTGAGDAAVAAIASLLVAGEADVEALARRATAWSAAAVLVPWAGSIHPDHRELARHVLVTLR